MQQYFVTWTIELDAETPRDAAKEALKIHRDPGSGATVFEVRDESGTTTMIDLEEDLEEDEEEG